MPKFTLFIVLSTALCGHALAQSGEVTVHFNSITAYYFNGMPDFNSNDNDRCHSTYASSPIAEPMTFHYEINPATSYQTGHALYKKQTVMMFPEGIKNSYSFMSDGVGPLAKEHILRITTTIDTQFQHINSHIMMNGGNDFNCVISGSNSIP